MQDKETKEKFYRLFKMALTGRMENKMQGSKRERLEKILMHYARKYELFVHGCELYHTTEGELNEELRSAVEQLNSEISKAKEETIKDLVKIIENNNCDSISLVLLKNMNLESELSKLKDNK